MLIKKDSKQTLIKSDINHRLEEAQNTFDNENFKETIIQCNSIIQLLDSQKGKYTYEYYRTFYLKGVALYNISDYQNALHCFNKGLNAGKGGYDCIIKKGEVLDELGCYAETLKLCDYIDRTAISGLRGVMSDLREETFIKYIYHLLENNKLKKYFSFDGNKLYGLKDCIITISKDDNADDFDYYLPLYEDLSTKYICDIKDILYIFNRGNKIKIITRYADIYIENNTCFIKEKLSIFTLTQLEKYFKPVPDYPTFFENLVDKNTDYGELLHINPLTEFEVYQVFNMDEGDTIIAELFTTTYNTEFHTYIPGMYEVLFDGNCIGFVLKRDNISIGKN